MFGSRRIPRHMLLSDSGGENHWLRRIFAVVFTLLVGFGLGLLASDSSVVRNGDCRMSGYGASPSVTVPAVPQAHLPAGSNMAVRKPWA